MAAHSHSLSTASSGRLSGLDAIVAAGVFAVVLLAFAVGDFMFEQSGDASVVVSTAAQDWSAYQPTRQLIIPLPMRR